MARRKARELAFQTLFQAERGEHDLWTVWEDVRVSSTADINEDDEGDVYGDPLDYQSLEFAQSLLRQFADHRTALDTELDESLEGWTFSQMSQTDLTILRLALTELRYMPDIPAQVTIEVAVRIAKRFGGEESGRFVNGVLGRLFEGPQVISTVSDTSSDVSVTTQAVASDVVTADVASPDIASPDVASSNVASEANTLNDDATTATFPTEVL
ncbi:MAG: transcription antitermination factor NusB [Deinococcota bacterium]